jgi:hypothetical protein
VLSVRKELRVFKVSKGIKERRVFRDLPVHKALLEHKDPLVLRVRPDLRVLPARKELKVIKVSLVRKALRVLPVHREHKDRLAHKAYKVIKAIKASKELRVIKALPLFGTSLAHTAEEPLTPLVMLRPMTGRLGIESIPMAATSVILQVRGRSGRCLPIRALRVHKATKAFKVQLELKAIRAFRARLARRVFKGIRVSKVQPVLKVRKA